MVIDGREKFAARVAAWMMASTLTVEEMDIRLACFDEEFNQLVIEASRKTRVA